jgi:ABC-2 type transport system permease protein
MTLSGILTPTLMLVLFNSLFGGTIGAGLDGAAYGGSYINYLVSGILIMTTVTGGCEATAVNLVTEMHKGIITPFRTIAIARMSVLTGQVLGSLIRTLLSAGLVFGVALLMGFRPMADLVAWIAALGVVALIAFAITWMGVVDGSRVRPGRPIAGGCQQPPLLFLLLSFTSSASVNTTATMSAGVRWFAAYQPLTPVTDTLRGLLLGTPIDGSSVILAAGWCVALALFGYLTARAVYNRSGAH